VAVLSHPLRPSSLSFPPLHSPKADTTPSHARPEYGRNLTLIRYPSFTRLVLVGLPNRLRGEIWELTCGSMFLRLGNPGVYAQILRDHEGRRSASTDDIEKDLHRS